MAADKRWTYMIKNMNKVLGMLLELTLISEELIGMEGKDNLIKAYLRQAYDDAQRARLNAMKARPREGKK